MQDFGKTTLALGRFTDDGGIIGVVGGAAFLFGFASNPLIGAAIALAVSNDIAAVGYQKQAARQHLRQHERELYNLPDANAEGKDEMMQPLQRGKFTQVHLEVHPAQEAVKFTPDSRDDGEDDVVADGWTERPWVPPKPDLSLLPIALFKDKVEGGNINVERLEDDAIREYATGRCWKYLKQFKHHDNVEYLVWFVFGIHKGKNQWYQLAADFCECCREHWLSARIDKPIDNRVTW